MPAHGYPIRHVAIRGYVGKSPAGKLSFPFLFAWSVCQSLFLMIADRPDVVLGTGGYVSAPPVLAAWLLRVPVGLLALDALPSKAVLLLARCAREVYAGFPECAAYITGRTPVVHTGNPLRSGIGGVQRSEGSKDFGLDPRRQTVLMFGGSQGAHALNMLVPAAIAARAGDPRWRELQFIVQTGPADAAAVAERLRTVPVKTVVRPYIEDMAAAFAASDLVISRAGSSVSETLACGLPSILVPFPHAASNHQEHNARSLERGGAAAVALERDLDHEKLAALIESIAFDPAKMAAMAGAARRMARPGAAAEVAARLQALASKG